jgi:hypothetical protein
LVAKKGGRTKSLWPPRLFRDSDLARLGSITNSSRKSKVEVSGLLLENYLEKKMLGNIELGQLCQTSFGVSGGNEKTASPQQKSIEEVYEEVGQSWS